MRGVVHENIVDYISHFAVESEEEVPSVHILMEYGSAGDLVKELSRFPGLHMSEPAARYYAMQVIAGTQYLHSKFIVHRDLHAKNIILKYNPDLSKTCMICDFGSCKICDLGCSNQEFHCDVSSINRLIELMLGFPFSPLLGLSKEAERLLAAGRPYVRAGRMVTDEPNTIRELVANFTWFAGPVDPPILKGPSPLLDRATVKSMGYSSPPPSPPVESDEPAPGNSRRSFAASASVQEVNPAQNERPRRSLAHRVRSSMSSMGRAIARPFHGLHISSQPRSQAPGNEDPANESQGQASRRRNSNHWSK